MRKASKRFTNLVHKNTGNIQHIIACKINIQFLDVPHSPVKNRSSVELFNALNLTFDLKHDMTKKFEL